MTFGKLGGNPIEFLSKPYEQCLYGIAVTHMPRYLIDMRLNQGETIFDKMGVPYDDLRKMDNPIAPVAKYYRSQLKEGESLWWTGDSSDETVSATIKLWKNVSPEDKRKYTIFGCVNYVNATLILDHSDTEKVYHKHHIPCRIEATLGARRERYGSGDVTLLADPGGVYFRRITEINRKTTGCIQADGKEIL